LQVNAPVSPGDFGQNLTTTKHKIETPEVLKVTTSRQLVCTTMDAPT